MRSRQGRVVCCGCRADVIRSAEGNNALQTESANGPTNQPTVPENDWTNGDSVQKNNTTDATTQGDAQSDHMTANHNGTNDVAEGSAAESRMMVPAGPARDTQDGLNVALRDRLLQGWTVMQESCPSCGVILMRNDEGRVTCVGCGAGGAPRLDVNTSGPETNGNALRGELVVGNSSAAAATSAGVDNRAITGGAARAMGGAASRLRLDTRGDRRNPLPAIADRGRVPALEAKPVDNGGTAHQRHMSYIDDVDNELRLAEIAAAENLRLLRLRLCDAPDAEARRVICAAMSEAARTIESVRKALVASLRML